MTVSRLLADTSRIFAGLSRFFIGVENLGLSGTCRLFALHHLSKSNQRTAIWVKKLNRKVYFRGSWDWGAMWHFLTPGYRICDTQKHPVRFIIDAGAHIGDETLRFRYYHPDAVITAIEPDPDNYDILQLNVQNDPKIVTFQAGLWSQSCLLKYHAGENSEAGHVSTSTDPTEEETITALSIPMLIKRSGFSQIDILKLDIEGAEREVFSNGYEEWVNQVNAIIVECHEKANPGTAFQMFRTLSSIDFNCYIQGENLVFIRNDSGWGLESALYLRH